MDSTWVYVDPRGHRGSAWYPRGSIVGVRGLKTWERIGNLVFSHFLHFLMIGLSYGARDEFYQLGMIFSTKILCSAADCQAVYGGKRR